MKKKIGKLMVAISIIALAVSGLAQARLITVPNFSFELDENGVHLTENANDITADAFAWNELVLGDHSRPGIVAGDTSPYVPDGDSYLMLKKETGSNPSRPYNADSIVWQILDGEPISEGDEYTLTFNATIDETGNVGNVDLL